MGHDTEKMRGVMRARRLQRARATPTRRVAGLAAAPTAAALGALVILGGSDEADPGATGGQPTLGSLVGVGTVLDYTPKPSPAALAEHVTDEGRVHAGGLVVQGRVAGYEPGPIEDVGLEHEADPGDQTILMEVAVEEVLAQRSISDPSDGVTVQLGGSEPDQTEDRLTGLRRDLPSGTPVLLYLVEVASDQAGSRYVVTPQGFIVDPPRGPGVVDLGLSTRYPDSSLADLRPDKDSFPEKTALP